MEREKIGGYETKLTPQVEQLRQRHIDYEKGWSEGEAQARPEDVRLAEYILSTIQIETLKDIFIEYLIKSGVPSENANTQALEKIFTRPLEILTAAYQPVTNQLIFSTSSAEFSRAKQLIAENKPLPEMLVSWMQLMFVHEVCHVFSRTRITSEEEEAGGYTLKIEGGYQVVESTVRSPESDDSERTAETGKMFEALNEGITQRIADEIFIEYAKRIGTFEQVEKFMQMYVKEAVGENPWRYFIYENQVDAMCDRIAQYVGVSRELVWQAFKRGYFENPQLFDTEVTELFKETFGESILRDLPPLGNKTPLNNLGAFDATYQIPHVQEYADKWLRLLGIKKETQDQS